MREPLRDCTVLAVGRARTEHGCQSDNYYYRCAGSCAVQAAGWPIQRPLSIRFFGSRNNSWKWNRPRIRYEMIRNRNDRNDSNSSRNSIRYPEKRDAEHDNPYMCMYTHEVVVKSTASSLADRNVVSVTTELPLTKSRIALGSSGGLLYKT